MSDRLRTNAEKLNDLSKAISALTHKDQLVCPREGGTREIDKLYTNLIAYANRLAN